MGRRLTKFLYRSKGSTQRRGEKQCLDCGEWKPPRDFYVQIEAAAAADVGESSPSLGAIDGD